MIRNSTADEIVAFAPQLPIARFFVPLPVGRAWRPSRMVAHDDLQFSQPVAMLGIFPLGDTEEDSRRYLVD